MPKCVLKDELIAIRDKYGDDRRTEIQDVEDEIDIEDLIEEEQCVFTLSHAGYCKRVPASTYRSQKRGGKGLKNYNITAKTGRIAGVAIVDDEDDVMLIENGGVLIRMAAADINVYKRDTQGVILMRVEAGNRVISVDRVDREPEETADEHEEA